MMVPIQFDRPGWLVLLLLLIPVLVFAWSGLTRRGARGRAFASTFTRCVIIILFAVAIARPIWKQTGKGVSLITVLDRSQSIPQQLQEQAVSVLQEWTAPSRRGEDDRLAVISVGREAIIGSMPDNATLFEPAANDPDGNATNLSKGITLALALLPRDTASRILVVSDGNETEGQVLSIADLAKVNGVPIDVLPLLYEHTHEVLVERVIVPSQSRKGQAIPVRVVLRSIGDATGTLHLLVNGSEIDLSADVQGSGLPLALRSGPNALVFDIPVDSGGPQKFEAMWDPDNGMDTIASNNTGIAVSFVTQNGIILLVTLNQAGTKHLYDILTSSGLEVRVATPQEIPHDSIGFSNYDAVILADIPRWTIDDLQEQHLHAFVHDLGGGLIITGGPTAFGAGGWIGSTLEQAMPIKCEPPQTRKLPRGALALIMHSCEMPRGNYWGQRMATAAVESLSEQDYIGIVEYDWNGGQGTLNNSGWTLPMQLAGDKVAAFDAINRLVFGDMQDFESPMQIALESLRTLDASQRHVIIITDGDPIGPSQELLEDYRASDITVSTVMVGGHGSAMDLQKMQGIATATGGRFYMVTDPNKLPSIFIKESQLNARSLLQEGSVWDVAMFPSVAGPVRDIKAVPQITGYVVTGRKGGFTQTSWVVPVSDGEDPLFAWWHYGLGKSIAFTSDIGSRWTTSWPSWSSFSDFWEGCIRWSMRGATPPNMMVTSHIEGGRGFVELEAVDAEADFMNFMRTKAVVIDPTGKAETITLQQTGPGMYHAEFDTDKTGAWLVNIVFQDADGATTGRIPTAVSVPYAREYAATTHNASLLHELALRTGGRVLSLDDYELINLFDSSDIEPPESPQSVWDLLAIIAASLLLIDIAIRRLWFDKKSMQSMFKPVGEITSSSVEALRKVHKSVESQTETKQQESTKQPSSSMPKPKAQSTPKSAKRQVEADDSQDSNANLSQLLKKKRQREEQGDD